MAPKGKQTSSRIATKAANLLNSSSGSKLQRSLAASALAQSSSGKKTSAAMESKASKALTSERTSALTKQLAGSVVSQSIKSR